MEGYMTVKEWLLRGFKIDAQIKSKLELIDMWSGYKTKASTEGAGGPNGYHETFKYMAQVNDARAEIEHQEESLILIKLEIQDIINKVTNPTYRTLLEQRYLLCKSWKIIADFMAYESEHVKGPLHKYSLIEAEKYIKRHQLRIR